MVKRSRSKPAPIKKWVSSAAWHRMAAQTTCLSCSSNRPRRGLWSNEYRIGLIEPAAVTLGSAVRRRQFVLDSGLCAGRQQADLHKDMPALIGINGRAFDPARIDVETKLGTTEIWEITSIGMAHPFHIHGALFR